MRYRLLCRLAGGLAGLAVVAFVVLLGLDEWLSRGATVRRGHIYGTAGGEPTIVYGEPRGTRCTVDGRSVLVGPRWRRWFDRFTGPAGGLRLPAEPRSRSVTCERAVRVVEGRPAALSELPRPWWLGALLGVAIVALVVRAWAGRALRRRLQAPAPVARGVWPVRPPVTSRRPRRAEGGPAAVERSWTSSAAPRDGDPWASGGARPTGQRPAAADDPWTRDDEPWTGHPSGPDHTPPTGRRPATAAHARTPDAAPWTGNRPAPALMPPTDHLPTARPTAADDPGRTGHTTPGLHPPAAPGHPPPTGRTYPPAAA
ncbi:hypothetical protein Val02_86960 [Virgisporangium aliadipatigenens]|uniref:Uncharacterized protein n=1 Tax=Virgisporangium aliadipatigenens TaxID=741659 RepID=A0A8J3YXX1_9ACTN|nr:hypothetical protein [Virgisporangium aliadipatigenens]GIJ51810.1 hypothetical protein Val02_86960 [Virgisporangium aliadipatigenens]